MKNFESLILQRKSFLLVILLVALLFSMIIALIPAQQRSKQGSKPMIQKPGSSPAPHTEAPTESAPEVAAAIAVQERYQDALLQIPGVVGVGIGQTEETGQVVIRVSVQRLTPELQRALPMDLEGIPVKIVVTGPYEAR